MRRDLDLTLRGICSRWAYGPLMDQFADGGPEELAYSPAFWAEVDALIEDILDQTPRRTTMRIKLALAGHKYTHMHRRDDRGI